MDKTTIYDRLSWQKVHTQIRLPVAPLKRGDLASLQRAHLRRHVLQPSILQTWNKKKNSWKLNVKCCTWNTTRMDIIIYFVYLANNLF